METSLAYSLFLAALLGVAGGLSGGCAGDEPSTEPVGYGTLCELATDCAVDDYCLDGTCEVRPLESDEEPGYPGLDSHQGVCRVVMYDELNDVESTLQVEQLNAVLFVVTDSVDSDSPWSVEVVLYQDGAQDIGATVPDVSYEELLEEYGLRDVGQLSFEQLSGYPCSEYERALIFFLIMEWFYFG